VVSWSRGHATINESTAYTIKISRWQQTLSASVVGQSTAAFTYAGSSDFGSGTSGLYSDKTSVTFDDFKVYNPSVRDPKTRRIGGLADTTLDNGGLRVTGSTRGGVAVAGP